MAGFWIVYRLGMGRMEVIYWGLTLDHTQSFTWDELEMLGVDVLYVLQYLIHPVRMKQGWKNLNLGDRRVKLLKPKGWLNQGTQIIDRYPHAINVFFGFWGRGRFLPLILYALFRKRKVAIIQEPYSISLTGYDKEESLISAWIKVNLRPMLYKIYALLLKVFSRGSKPCVLAISLIGKDQFSHIGFDQDTIFPFGFFVPKGEGVVLTKAKSQLHLVYVGALIKRKGLDIITRAINAVNQEDIRVFLDVYGPGNADLYFSPSSKIIQYKGIVAPEEAQSVMSHYDALVLPSRHDGWGMVIVEALLQGIPCIVSDRVGAKCLVEASGAGMIFRNEDVNGLVEILENLVSNPKTLDYLREMAGRTEERILPKTSAIYLKNVFDFHFSGIGERPRALWTNQP
jgi:glycosyltransferase involved in cell wall biosynthesis